ncbi:DUF5983 family protein [Eoetvoesiella caeni]
MTTNNPFIRGFNNLKITRKLAINYGSEFPLAYRSLHPSQEHLNDNSLPYSALLFGDDHAYVLDPKQQVPKEIQQQATDSGTIMAVIFEIVGEVGGNQVHVGDLPTRDSANIVVEQLKFHTGHYSRCWEISNSHVSEDEFEYLSKLAGSSEPTGLFFEVFNIPASQAVGIKLIATPWDCIGDHLKTLVDGGVPLSLASLLILAARADTRILILDPDAQVLDGLAVFDW